MFSSGGATRQARKRTALGALAGTAATEVRQPSKKKPRKSGMGRKSMGRRVSFAADLEQTHYYEKVRQPKPPLGLALLTAASAT